MVVGLLQTGAGKGLPQGKAKQSKEIIDWEGLKAQMAVCDWVVFSVLISQSGGMYRVRCAYLACQGMGAT